MNTGKIILTLRERRSLSRKELAELSGFAYSQIWNWENNKVCPSMDNFYRIANAVGYEIIIKPKWRKDGKNES